MIFNNYMFEERTLYTYKEVLKFIDNLNPDLQLNTDKIRIYLDKIGMIIGSPPNNPTNWTDNYSLSFFENNQVKSNAVIIFQKIYARYKTHYAIMCNKDDDVEEKSKNFLFKVFNTLDYTFVKYDTLLSLYESQKSHLLDKLGRTRTGERELATNVSGNQTASGTSSGTTSQTGAETTSGSSASSSTKDTLDLHNDTPQTTDVVATMEGNQYVSDLRKIHESGSESGQTSGTSNNTSQGSSSGQTSSTETSQTASTGTDEFTESEMWDTKTMMEKLDEIEKNFSNLIKKWLNEFDELFIEEVNY